MSRVTFFSGFIAAAIGGIAAFWIHSQFEVYSDCGSCRQTYPNIGGRLLLENDSVVVQRFSFPVGQ